MQIDLCVLRVFKDSENASFEGEKINEERKRGRERERYSEMNVTEGKKKTTCARLVKAKEKGETQRE